MDSLYAMMNIIGPLLLGAVLLYAIMSNRKKRSAADLAKTERGTRALREDLDREDKAREHADAMSQPRAGPVPGSERHDETSIARPNLSTAHQPVGGAQHPRDTLDRDSKRDPLSGGTIPDDYDPATGKRVGDDRTAADPEAARVAQQGRERR